MKKQSFILAVALATFTLTACGEKTQTPEEIALQEMETFVKKRYAEMEATPEEIEKGIKYRKEKYKECDKHTTEERKKGCKEIYKIAATPEEAEKRKEAGERIRAKIDTFNMDTTGKSEEEKEKIQKAKRAFIKSLTTKIK